MKIYQIKLVENEQVAIAHEVHPNMAKIYCEKYPYTQREMHGYMSEEDFKAKYKYIKEDESTTNREVEGPDAVDNGDPIDGSNNSSGSGANKPGRTQRKRAEEIA